MLKRFTVVLVILIIVASMGTVFAATNVLARGEKTMNELIKGEPMLANEAEIKAAFNDQMILMMYIWTIDQMLLKMTPEQKQPAVQAFQANTLQASSPKLMQSLHEKMLDMNQDQLSSLLDKVTSIMTKDQMKSALHNTNQAVSQIRGLALD